MGPIQKYTPLNTWIPVDYKDANLSIGKKAANAFEDFFYLGGRKARVINSEESTLTVEMPKDQKQPWYVTALKVLFYFTIILPILMLIGKAIFRLTHDIKILGDYESPSFFDPHAEAKELKNDPLFRSRLNENTWVKVKFNNCKNSKYLYSFDNGSVKVQHVVKQLGKGGFGKVKLLHDLGTGNLTALKIANPDADPSGELLTNESNKLQQINAVAKSRLIQEPPLTEVRSVQRLYNKKGDKPVIRKAFETTAFDGSIQDLLLEKKDLPLDQRLYIVNQLVQGTRVLHVNGIAHNDIKPDNILYKDNGYDVTIIDLSGAIFENSGNQNIQYTRLYSNINEVKSAVNAPDDVSFDTRLSLDMRAVGITIFQILTGITNPFVLAKTIQSKESIDTALSSILKEEKYDSLRELIIKMITEDVKIKKALLGGASKGLKKACRFVGLKKVVDNKIQTDRPCIESVCAVVEEACRG